MSHYSQLFGQVFVVVFLAVLFSIVLFGTPLSLNLKKRKRNTRPNKNAMHFVLTSGTQDSDCVFTANSILLYIEEVENSSYSGLILF